MSSSASLRGQPPLASLRSQQLRACSRQHAGSSPSLLSHRTPSSAGAASADDGPTVASNRPWASPDSYKRHLSSASSIGRTMVGSGPSSPHVGFSSNDSTPCAASAPLRKASLQRAASMRGRATDDAAARPAEPTLGRRAGKVSWVAPTDPSASHVTQGPPSPAEDSTLQQTEAQRRGSAGDKSSEPQDSASASAPKVRRALTDARGAGPRRA